MFGSFRTGLDDIRIVWVGSMLEVVEDRTAVLEEMAVGFVCPPFSEECRIRGLPTERILETGRL